MKVLLVTWNFPPRLGGAENLAYHLAASLGEIEEVTVLTGAAPRAASPAAEPFRLRRAPLPRFAGFLAWLPWALGARLLGRRPDVVLVLSAPLAGLVVLPCLLLGVPRVALVFGSDMAYGGALYRRFLRWTLPRYRRVLAISRHVAGLAAGLGVPPGRIDLLPPGVDPAFAAGPAAPEALPASDAPVVLFVGRVVPRKGLGPFLRHAFPRVAERVRAELWVVGGEPSDSLAHREGELARLRGWLAADPVGQRVRFLGRVPDEVLRAAYRRAAVLVLPAVVDERDVEGFGIVFLEAALFGVPAVATAAGGIPDAVVDGETGLLAAPGDWEGLAGCLVRLLEDGALRERLGAAARRRAAGELAWGNIAERCSRLLHGARR
ncbi:MAG TPA: glycosyltransferase family 4 protein [Thermoanaerobaculia bacterium]|nr:glycosyltransferase family 4 protein [Thermoanaerobaculia bacterium]